MNSRYYIAWANGTSLAKSPDQDEVIKEALKIVQSPLWNHRHKNGTKITITEGIKQQVVHIIFWPSQSI